ncbi:MAG: type II and III secretion system protein [Elusimicrobia bacterium]|nr:type II and III secretion system protein [Elusimicrobiota bacterium]
MAQGILVLMIGRRVLAGLTAFLVALMSWPPSVSAEDLIAISADIVEIGGSVERDLGVSWNDFINLAEQSIPGIFTVGEFSRLEQLQGTIRALENEGKAQLLSNPKIVTKNGTSASFLVGGEMPIQIVGATGSVGVDFKKFGVLLNVLPVTDKDRIDAQVQLEVSNPDFTKTVNGVPSIVTRQIQTEVDVKQGDTVVIGGLKRSEKQTSYRRVPILGHLPIIGSIFTYKKTLQVESTLFLFVSFEILKT